MAFVSGILQSVSEYCGIAGSPMGGCVAIDSGLPQKSKYPDFHTKKM